MSACFTQLCSGTGGEAAVLEQHTEPHADSVIAGGTGCSPVGASTSQDKQDEASVLWSWACAGLLLQSAALTPSQCPRELPTRDAVPLQLPAWVWLPHAGPIWCLAEICLILWGWAGKAVALLAHLQRELLWGIPSVPPPRVGSGSCSDRCSASPGVVRGRDTPLKSAVLTQGLLPLPGRMTSTLHVLLIYIICILIYST